MSDLEGCARMRPAAKRGPPRHRLFPLDLADDAGDRRGVLTEFTAVCPHGVDVAWRVAATNPRAPVPQCVCPDTDTDIDTGVVQR